MEELQSDFALEPLEGFVDGDRELIARRALQDTPSVAIDIVGLASGVTGERRRELLRRLLKLEIGRRHLRAGRLPFEEDIFEAYPALSAELPVVIDRLKLSIAPIPRQIGGYVNLVPVGKGGQGRVFSAMAKFSKQAVAIKLVPIQPGSDAKVVKGGAALLLSEISALSRVKNEYVVTPYQADVTPYYAYLVLELLDHTLAEEAYTSLDAKKVADDFAKIAIGLHAAHAAGVYHYDLKPSNVMFNKARSPRIIDFGLSKDRLDQIRAEYGEGVIAGTYCYMSPEQIQGDFSNSVAIDIFGLGATLYSVLTGKAPYPVDGARELAATCSWDREALKASPFPKELRRICEKAMEVKPGDRFTSAAEMCEALRQFAEVPARKTRTKQNVVAISVTAVIVGLIVTVIALSIPRATITVAPPLKPSWIETQAQANNIDLSKIKAEDFKLRANYAFATWTPLVGTLHVSMPTELHSIAGAGIVSVDGATWDELLREGEGNYYILLDGKDLDSGAPVFLQFFNHETATTRECKVGVFTYPSIGWKEYQRQTGIHFEGASTATWVTTEMERFKLSSEALRKYWPVIKAMEIGDSADSLSCTIPFHKEDMSKLRPTARIPDDAHAQIERSFYDQLDNLDFPADIFVRFISTDNSASEIVEFSRRPQVVEAYKKSNFFSVWGDGLWHFSTTYPLLYEIQEVRIGSSPDDLSQVIDLKAHTPERIRSDKLPAPGYGYYEGVVGPKHQPLDIEFMEAVAKLGNPDTLYWQVRMCGSIVTDVRSTKKSERTIGGRPIYAPK